MAGSRTRQSIFSSLPFATAAVGSSHSGTLSKERAFQGLLPLIENHMRIAGRLRATPA
jgi:hypothetical protein